MFTIICGLILLWMILSLLVYIFVVACILGKIIIHDLASVSDALVAAASVIGSYAVGFYEDFKIFLMNIEFHYEHIIKMMNNGCNNFPGDVSHMMLAVYSSIQWMSEQTKSELLKLLNIKLTASVASDSVSVTVTFVTSVPLQSICGLLFIYLLIIYRRYVFWFPKLVGLVFIRVVLTILKKTLPLPVRNYIPNIWRLSRVQEDNANQNVSGSSKTTDPYHFCVICQDELKSIVLLPCRHLCLCQDCFRQLRRYRRECPMCRQPYEHSIQVYA